ncbi:signal peptidase II [Oscillibacter sp.]|uniref:signal peptidase II n=1 Tax=Oscillibacter sp. TaxID=1945593 RepID=UPI002897D705|nr:signal peptidase II [Oscillibacter sp.]
MLYLIAGAGLLAVDQWVKYWVTAHLELGASTPLLPDFLELLRVHNYGAAWSSFSGMRWLLLAMTGAIVLAVIFAVAKKLVRHPLGLAAATLIISGGLGNIIDRARLGYVVDMFNFQFMHYPVFNVADICIVSGAILGAVYYLWFYEKYDGKEAANGNADAESKS